MNIIKFTLTEREVIAEVHNLIPGAEIKSLETIPAADADDDRNDVTIIIEVAILGRTYTYKFFRVRGYEKITRVTHH